MIRKLFKYLWRFLQLITILLASYLLVAIVLSFIPYRGKSDSCEANQRIHVASNGLHLDLIFSREQFPEPWLQQIDLASESQFLAVGWGDKEFYINTPRWRDLSIMRAIKATFFRTDAALHVTAYHSSKSHWIAVPVCDHQLQTLINYAQDSFKRDDRGNVMEVTAAGYSSRDRFYDAHGNYNFVHTCNQWVNQGLKQAEIKTSLWSPFDKGVLYHLR